MVFHHVVIHKSALGMLESNLLKIKISQLWRNEHVHLIVHSTKKLKNSAGIRSEWFDSSKLDYFDTRYFQCSEKKHDFFCDATFSISPLKNTCIKIILRNLDCLHNMEKLELPKRFLIDIFQQSKSRFHLRESDPSTKKSLLQCYKIFGSHTERDIVFDKKFVVWFQDNGNYEFLRGIYVKYSERLIVHYDFVTTANNSVKLCLKCMKFESENGYYQRRYMLKEWRFPSSNVAFFQNPMNWCHACQQVPLFQLLTVSQFDDSYTFSISEYFEKYISFGKVREPVIKTEYFEKGVKVKSHYVFSQTSFGGINHSYIN